MGEIAVTRHAAYLDIAVGHAFWERMEWTSFWGDDAFWVEALVLNRLLDPHAKIHLQPWVTATALPAYDQITPQTLDPYAVYRVLDRMADRETEVHQWLVSHALPTAPTDHEPTLFYDLTSTYVDGVTSPLAKSGYSRDHRPDRKQIVIGLLITATGDPLYWKVWPGNTPDVTTVDTIVTGLRDTLGIAHCILVFDRGMVSAANLAAIEAAHHTYLTAVDRDALASLSFWEEGWPETVPLEDWQAVVAQRGWVAYDSEATLWFREWTTEDHRWVLAFDVRRFRLELAVQAAAIAAVEAWVQAKNTELAAARRARQLAPLERDLRDLLRRKHLTGIVEIEYTPCSVEPQAPRRTPVKSWQVSLRVDPAARHAAQRVFGVTCFQTNATTTQMSTEAVIAWYRRKNRVEEAFHEIKSPLALRPLFLSRSRRIRAHVMACVLAYGIYNAMEERLRQQSLAESPATVLDALASSQINRLKIQSTNQTWLTLTESSPQQRAYLQALDCESLIANTTLQPILKSMQSWL